MQKHTTTTAQAQTPSKNLELEALGLHQPAIATHAPLNLAALTFSPPLQPQAPPKPMARQPATEDEMYQASKHLDAFVNFDGEETKETEAVWQKRLENLINLHKLLEEQKVELWVEKVKAGSVAQDWLDGIPKTSIDRWGKLKMELEP
ncbi:hypothetical protein FS749_012423 [Ceratobasidium sp. UAMH 11750]|nr:hypothetical protein FS749_012423 [Ceratobasidium sp. UAMH 11750]